MYQTYTGKTLNLLDIKPEDIDIEDIAHSLANQCRFAGHCQPFHSVARHSILVSLLVPLRYRLAALLHDAAEAYLSDLPRPVKELFPEYVKLEDKILKVIFKKFKVPTMFEHWNDLIMELDNNVLKYEIYAYTCNKYNLPEKVTHGIHSVDEGIGSIAGTPPFLIKKLFLSYFKEYTNES